MPIDRPAAGIGTGLSEAGALRRVRRLLTGWAAMTGALALVYFWAYSSCTPRPCAPGVAETVNLVGQGALLLACFWVVTRLVRGDKRTLWTPAVVFPLATGLFFGFGNMSVLFGNEATRQDLLAGAYPVDAAILLRTNLLTMLGVTTAALALALALKFRWGPSRALRPAPAIPVGAAATLFLSAGLLLKYGLILPSDYGLTGLTVPGSIRKLAYLADIGLALAAYLSVKGHRTWTAVFWTIWPPYLALTTLEFSKEVTAQAIALPAIGAYMAHGSARRLLPWLVGIVLVLVLLQDVNTAARMMIFQRAKNITDASLSERWDTLRHVLTEGQRLVGDRSGPEDEIQSWWVRLNYAGVQNRAMEEFDRGNGGEWYQSPLVYLVPRLLWPDKPVVQHPGLLFNREVTRYHRAITYVGMTVYAEGYWIMGWPGVPLFSAVMGAILGLITRLSLRQVGERNFIYLPVVFLGLQMGAIQPVNYLQNGVLGAATIYVGLSLVIGTALALRRPRPTRSLAARPTPGWSPA